MFGILIFINNNLRQTIDFLKFEKNTSPFEFSIKRPDITNYCYQACTGYFIKNFLADVH